MIRLPLLAALALGGCTAPTVPVVQAGHPASARTAAAPTDAAGTRLAPAEEPVLPLALRRDGPSPAGGMGGMDHGAMAGRHEAGPTPSAPMRASAPAPGLAETLDAYLAVHDALATDRLADATAQAAILASALEALTAQPPADDPHLWHARADDLAVLRTQTAALGAAPDLDAARSAFGVLSVAVVRLVQDLGAPAGYDLAVMTCGMAPGIPEGGVWVQRAGATANPYFGAAMPTCGSGDEAAAAPDGHAGH